MRCFSFLRLFCLLFPFISNLFAGQSLKMLPSTEADPDCFIDHCVNIINGDYCESVTDLMIAGPDPLLIQRYYNAKDYVSGEQVGGWRIFPQRFLVIGEACLESQFQSTEEKRIYAFSGERSGGILTYCGWKNSEGVALEPLSIDAAQDGKGIVNTYAKEMSGQTNHRNNLLYYDKEGCKILLGDGTLRTYEQVPQLPHLLLGEELIPSLASKVSHPQYWRLRSERLPSGNQLFFSYDSEGHLVAIEMQNAAQTKMLSWIHLTYHFSDKEAQVKFETSDEKTLNYHFTSLDRSPYPKIYTLSCIQGSYIAPCFYQYESQTPFCFLIQKTLPEGREKTIEYDLKGRVKTLKLSHPTSGQPEPIYTFDYRDNETIVLNAFGHKKHFQFDSLLRLKAIFYYQQKGDLYRVERKIWGQSPANIDLLLAKSIEGGNGRIYSYRAFEYDENRNVIEEKLYGNLTGHSEDNVKVDEKGKLFYSPDECSRKIFIYSKDGFNLLIQTTDSKENNIVSHYLSNTNLLKEQFIYDQGEIKKRTFYEYNEDAVCTTIIEDDCAYPDARVFLPEWGMTERHITTIQPKQTLPGVGLPEITEKKAWDIKKKQEILIGKLINRYDAQGHLCCCETYDSKGIFAYREEKLYNHLGLLVQEVNRMNKTVHYHYDACGNRIEVHDDGKTTLYHYDFRNQLIQIDEIGNGLQLSSFNKYDLLGRKISSTDFCDHTTEYEYDEFDRLTKIIHAPVIDENGKLIRPVFCYDYDLFGHVTSLTDPQGFTTYKTYNLRGKPTKISYPDGTYELFKYDIEGHLHRSFSKEKILTSYDYDYLGRLTYSKSSIIAEDGEYFFARRAHRYNAFHCLFDKYGYLVKHYTFDPTGKVIKVLEQADFKDANDPESHCTEFSYDTLGRITSKKIWFGMEPEDYTLECLNYDLLGNPLEKWIEDSKGHVLLRKGLKYDSEGNCIEEYSFQEGKEVP